MSLHYILDGYNILKNSEFKKIKTLKDQRYALIRIIKEKKPFGSKYQKITIVFDGKDDIFGLPELSDQNIEVVFTRNESADDWIKKKIVQKKIAKNTVVVTDDKEIVYFSRSYCAQVIRVKDFLKKLLSRDFIPADKLIKPELSFSQVNKINEELKKLWLKE